MRMFHRIVESPQPPQDIDAIWLCGEDFHHFHHGRWEPMPAPKDGNVWMAIKELRCAICRLKKEVEGGGVKHIFVNGVECEISDDGSVSLSIPTKTSDLNNDSGFTTITEVTHAITTALSGYQPLLESGTNIKTINGNSILGSGNIDIQGGGGSYTAGDNISISSEKVISVTGITELIATKQDKLIDGVNIKTINSKPLLGEGNIDITGGDVRVGFKSTAFKRSNADITTIPQGGTYEDPIPEGDWSDGVPEGSAQLWMTTSWFYSDSPTVASWSMPVKVTDTATIDMKFSSVVPYRGTPDEYSDDWHDASHASTSDVYMAVKITTNGSGGDWAITKIKGEKGADGRDGRDGTDGTSVRILGSIEDPDDLPASGSEGDSYIYNGPDTTVQGKLWKAGDLIVWDGDSWEDVGQIKGPAGASYKVFLAFSDDPTGNPMKGEGESGKYIGMYVGDASLPRSTNYSDYAPWTKFQGQDGFGYESVYKRTSSYSAPSIPISQNWDDFVPDGWADNPIGVSPAFPFCWKVERKKKNGVWGPFKGDADGVHAALWSHYGENGADGANGTDAEIWRILCSPVTFEKKENGTFSPDEFDLSVLHVVGETLETLAPTELADNYIHLYYSVYKNGTWGSLHELVPSSDTISLTEVGVDSNTEGLLLNIGKKLPGQRTIEVDELSMSFFSFGKNGYSIACPYRGEYKSTTTYYGNEHRRDIVEHQGHYYIAAVIEGSEGFKNQEPTELSIYWEPFGEEFSSVATDILFANLSYIDNLGVHYLSVFDDNGYNWGGMKPHDSDGPALLWLGGTPANANFRVDEDGTLHAKNGFFSGKIESADGIYRGYLETTFEDLDSAVWTRGQYQMIMTSPNVRVKPAPSGAGSFGRVILYLPPAIQANEGKICTIWIDPSTGDFENYLNTKLEITTSSEQPEILYLHKSVPSTSGAGEIPVQYLWQTIKSIKSDAGYVQFTCISHKGSEGTSYLWTPSNIQLSRVETTIS